MTVCNTAFITLEDAIGLFCKDWLEWTATDIYGLNGSWHLYIHPFWNPEA